MPQETHPTEHKESFFHKILDHHHDKHGNEGQATEGGLHSELKKDQGDFKQYIKEDRQLEEEGQTYGGLM